MNYFAELIGRVMISAVTLPKNDNTDKDLKNYVEVEFRKHDRGFVMDSLSIHRK